MSLRSDLVERLRSLLFRRQNERELKEELRFHLEEETADRIRRGADPGSAEREARIALGGVEQVREQVRDARGVRPLQDVISDTRLALRAFRREPAYSLTVVATVATCLAVFSAVFTVVRSVILRPLDVPEPERLVYVFDTYPKMGVDRTSGSIAFYDDLRTPGAALQDVSIYRPVRMTAFDSGLSERMRGLWVTPSFFAVARATAAVGRVFTEEEVDAGDANLIVLSHGFAHDFAGAAGGALGRTVELNGTPYRVIGVMPPGFDFLDSRARFWIPMAFSAQDRAIERRHNHGGRGMVARLAPDANLSLAQQQLDAVNAAEIERFPAVRGLLADAGFRSVVVPLQADVVREVRSTLYLLWAGGAFVLLIGVVNLVGLALVRAHARLSDLATRYVLGATGWRLARQRVTDAAVLTLPGGAMGIGLSATGLDAMAAFGLLELPRAQEIGLDLPIVGVTFAISLAIGVAIGLWPLLATRRRAVTAAAIHRTRTVTATANARIWRRAVASGQVALAAVLLVGAGLFLTSFRRMLAIDPGFIPDNVMTASVSPVLESDEALRAFYEHSTDAIRALPGVEAVGLTGSLPLAGDLNSNLITAVGYTPAPGESMVGPLQVEITPGYFEAMGIRLLEGRDFDGRDVDGSLPVVIVDERLARRFWPDGEPVGGQMFEPDNEKDLSVPRPDTPRYTVVGVVASIHTRDLTGDDEVGTYYLPYAQRTHAEMTFVIRTAGDPAHILPAARRAISQLDPRAPLFDTRTMMDLVHGSVRESEMAALLAAVFGASALVLAILGVYGVLAYLVTRRTQEIGIRIALGSTRRAVFALVVGEGLIIVTAGLTLGLAGVIALQGLLAAHLYAVSALSPAVVASALGGLGLLGLLAGVVPAVRAARIDAVIALNTN